MPSRRSKEPNRRKLLNSSLLTKNLRRLRRIRSPLKSSPRSRPRTRRDRRSARPRELRAKLIRKRLRPPPPLALRLILPSP
jgi:hypothetical protein